MALYVKSSDVPDAGNALAQRGPEMSTKLVHGNDCNMMLATRPPGYHSNPHKHDSEQLNYVVSGDIWVFVDDQAFHVEAGDFYRVPRNAVHWGWVRSDQPCTILEVHAPALDPSTRKNIVGLYDKGETPAVVNPAASIKCGDEY